MGELGETVIICLNMGCGSGQSSKTVPGVVQKGELLSILPENEESCCAKKLEDPPELPKPASNPVNAVWKELSTNDESLSRKDATFGGSHKHVRSSRAFGEDVGKKKRQEKPAKPEDPRTREIDDLLRDITSD